MFGGDVGRLVQQGQEGAWVFRGWVGVQGVGGKGVGGKGHQLARLGSAVNDGVAELVALGR